MDSGALVLFTAAESKGLTHPKSLPRLDGSDVEQDPPAGHLRAEGGHVGGFDVAGPVAACERPGRGEQRRPVRHAHRGVGELEPGRCLLVEEVLHLGEGVALHIDGVLVETYTLSTDEATTFNAARRGGIRINGNSPSGYGYADDFAIKVPAA